jgi:hypothetical protein
MTPGYRAIRFDALEDVPWKDGLTLRPVRSQLGLLAFGAAGFVGRMPGDLVVEAHTEQEGRGHQELYVVLRGAARFTVDGETVDAPAGTLVVVEPHVHREAVATEPDTRCWPSVGRRPSNLRATSTWRACAAPSADRRRRWRSRKQDWKSCPTAQARSTRWRSPSRRPGTPAELAAGWTRPSSACPTCVARRCAIPC